MVMFVNDLGMSMVLTTLKINGTKNTGDQPNSKFPSIERIHQLLKEGTAIENIDP